MPDLKDGRLELAWLNEKIKTTYTTDDLPIPYRGIIPAVDTDGDGQEEMQFFDKETGKPVILKGEKEFSQE